MPIYNGEKYLEKVIASLLSQTFSDFELIISDNASTDRTEEICRAFLLKDSRIKYFRNKENLGAGYNYNKVFRMSSGQYFKWAADDDIHAPIFLEKCVEILDKDPNVVVVYSQSKFIDEYGNPFESYSDRLDLKSKQPHERFRIFLERPGMCTPVFGLFRRDILSHTGLIGNYPRSDRNLIGEITLWGQIVELPEQLFFRRMDGHTSIDMNRSERELAQWFDPKAKAILFLPRVRRFYEYMMAINRAPISFSQRLRCHLIIARYLLYPTRWKGFLDDLHAIGHFFKGS